MAWSRLSVLLTVASCVALLSGCDDGTIEHMDPAATVAQSAAQIESHGAHAGHQAQSGDGAQSTSECVPPVLGAYPCAGGPVPEGAELLRNVGSVRYIEGDIATLMLPSEHIGCEVVHTRLTCLVSTWPHEIDPDRDVRVPGAPSINLDSNGPIHMEAKADAPFWGGGIEGVPRGQVLPYGTVWYYKEFVFASEKNGLTFWNVNSGHGALINGDGFWPF